MELDDAYVPYMGKNYELTQMRRLPLATLVRLARKWCRKFGFARRRLSAEHLEDDLHEFVMMKYNRKVVTQRLLAKYWPDGLNVYQLSQLDSCIVQQHSFHYRWHSKTIYKSKHERTHPHVDRDAFVNVLYETLTKHHYTHIYQFRHNNLPLMCYRVQLFDRPVASSGENQHSDKLVAIQTYYVAFMEDSEVPIIIHTAETGVYATLIQQAVKRALSTRTVIHLHDNELEPVRSIEKMFLVCGATRFSEAMGRWVPYAKGETDVSPLGNTGVHRSIVGQMVDPTDIQSKSMLKFKGSTSCHQGRHVYESLVPVERATFVFQDEVTREAQSSPGEVTVKFKFKGTDIFAGLHKLCDKRLVDIDKVPGWLAGENGNHSGTVDAHGNFIKKVSKKNLL
ncbi:Chl4p KNAG_0A04020 [Huiozyma naganishii CBS 8797]|uniref:Uncharacterized protein n=1 Tax=Huiozyma naganishii (strain ATCC MYA-139 / BCRC 22969 / CBS 8797 / KCTC 17520 / NBRC 10181 / NCYC 3082 / Yp74L-3) TaxID=1071383 RepID=J7S3N5_HUIN7|nr:hypothetical protein KNAG_0A04020 [Kazachstania naganishii CBS 8797]CCK68081.1 hypothetical protein KNAG_0A04020 [Kazachstania naganishii CBS 8797]